MPRSDERLRKLDDLEAPSAWARVRDRLPDPSLDTNATLQLGEDKPASRAGRVGLIAAALVIGLATTVGLAMAFRDRPTLAPGGSPSSVLQVSCDGNTVTVDTPIVAAQADGVHIVGSVTDIPDADILVRSSGDPSATYLSGSGGVDGEFVRPVPPGDARVGCATSSASNPMNDSRMNDALTASFTIVDPDGLFVPYVPDCSDTLGIGPPRVIFIDKPLPATAEDAVRSDIDGLVPGDVVEPAGYVQASESLQTVRITRDGDIIGSFHVRSRDGGFESSGGLVCTDSGLTQKNSGLVGTA